MLERHFTFRKLEELTSIPVATWQTWAATGVIPRVKLRNRTLIRERDVLALLHEGKDEAQSQRCRQFIHHQEQVG